MKETTNIRRRISALRKTFRFNLGHNAQEVAKQIWERKRRIERLEKRMARLVNSESR